jgi:aspartate carbamoyltransferase catalytic subunit
MPSKKTRSRSAKKTTTSPSGDVFLSQQTALPVYVKHVLAASQFNPSDLYSLFARASYLQANAEDMMFRRGLQEVFKGRQLCSLFYEPSTRTRLSFETAATKMGMGVVSTENAAEFSSAAKGETIEDTIRVLNTYGFDAIVLRHNEKGAAERAASVSSVPIINAGDGAGEHPTQSLLDAYTIYRQFGRLDNLRIVIGGDLKHGRTARSLSQVLSRFPGNQITFVSVPELQMGDDIKDILRIRGTAFSETDDMRKAFEAADVVYWTRLQKERLENPSIVPKKGFIIDQQSLAYLPKKAIILHPLPRVDEISPSVDDDPRAKYFEQAGNGLYVRMALLEEVLAP